MEIVTEIAVDTVTKIAVEIGAKIAAEHTAAQTAGVNELMVMSREAAAQTAGPTSETPKTADNLIVPEPNTIAVEHSLNGLEISFRRHNDTACATDRLSDH